MDRMLHTARTCPFAIAERRSWEVCGAHDPRLSQRMEQRKGCSVRATLCQGHPPQGPTGACSTIKCPTSSSRPHITMKSPPSHPTLQLSTSAQNWWPNISPHPHIPPLSTPLTVPAPTPLQIRFCSQIPTPKGSPSPAELGDSPHPRLGSALRHCSGAESSPWLPASPGAKQPSSRCTTSTMRH